MLDRLSPAEAALRAAVARGSEADVGRDIDPRSVDSPAAWDESRTVRARVIDELARNTSGVYGAAVRLTGARVVGGFRFRYGRLGRPIRLDLCWIDDVALFAELTAAGIELVRCRVPDLLTESVDIENAISVRECHVESVTMVDTRVHRSASFEDSRFTGKTTLFQARNLAVGGDLLLNRARLFASSGEAVHAERLRVDGGLGLIGVRARGPVTLSGSSVVGRVDLTDAVLRHREGVALDARRMVAGGLQASGLRCSGVLDLGHSSFSGRVSFDAAVLANPGDDALLASDIEADHVEAENGTRILGRALFQRGVIRDMLAMRGVEIRNPGGDAVIATGAQLGSLVADHASFTGRAVFDEIEATSVSLAGSRAADDSGSWAVSFQSATIRRDVNFEHMRVQGGLNIKSIRVGAAVFLSGAQLEGKPRSLGASRAVIGERLILGQQFGCRGDLDLAHIDLGKSLAMDGARVRGLLRLFQARVRSDVLLRGAYVESPGIGIDATGLRVGGRFTARGTVCDGAIQLTAAVADSIVFTGAQIYNPEANALTASRIEVRGDLVLGDDPYTHDPGSFRADGRVVLRDARVGGDIVLAGAVLSMPDHRAFDGTGLHVGGKVSLERTEVNGTVTLDQAQVRRRIVLSDTTLTGHGVDSADGPIGFSAMHTTSDELLVDRGVFHGALRLNGSAFAAGVSVRNAALEAAGGAALLGTDLTAGVLRLTALTVDGAIVLARCRIGGDLLLSGGVYRHPGQIAIDAAHAQVSGAVIVRGVELTGTLVLRRAEVGYVVQLESLTADVGSPSTGRAALDQVISAAGLRVEGNIECRRLRTVGQISLADASLSGRLLFRGGGSLANPGRTALYAANIQVGGSLEFGSKHAEDTARMEIVGDVRLDRAHLDEVWWENVAISEGAAEPVSGEHSDEVKALISLREAVVARRVLMNGLDIEPIATSGRTVVVDLSEMQGGTIELPPGETAVDLRDSEVRTLVLDPEDTTTVMLSGLTFDDPGGVDVDTALTWLRRDPTGYHHQVYEQLAAYYSRSGDDTAARTVLLARQRHRRDLLGRSSGQVLLKVWGYLQDWTVGYGYRPGLAAVWFVGLLTFGTAFFWGRTLEPVEEGVHPTFNPFSYTLDQLIPLVNLGQDTAWDPRGLDLVVTYGLIFVGAVIASTVVAAVTRVLNRR